MAEEQFRAHARGAVTEFGITKPDDPSWPDFEQWLSFGIAEPGEAAGLQAAMQRAEKEIGGSPGRLFHLAVPPARRLRPWWARSATPDWPGERPG